MGYFLVSKTLRGKLLDFKKCGGGGVGGGNYELSQT